MDPITQRRERLANITAVALTFGLFLVAVALVVTL